MGGQAALSSALTGMRAAETTIDVVGNNVANANTVGFKQSRALFSTQFQQTLSLGSGPTASNGGTNPRQIGLGTQVAVISPDFTQGTLEISSSPLDVAIQGEGFFIAQGAQGEVLYTRSGQFSTNSDNEIVTSSGHRVMGYGVDDDYQIQPTGLVPLTIPVGSAAVAKATQNVFLEGTLIPTGDVGDVPSIIQSSVLSDGTFEAPPTFDTDGIQAVTPPVVDSSTVAADTTPGNVAAGTYQYRIAFVDAEGNEGAPSDFFGPITTTGSPGVDESVFLDDLPTADGTNFVGRNIYRTDASGSGDYNFVASLNATDTSFTDGASDADLLSLPNASVLNDQTLDQGNYSYYITYYNTSNGLESRPTPIIGPVSVGGEDRRIRLDNIPQPTTPDYNAVRIYRNLANKDAEFYRVAQLTSGETMFIDGQPDADIEDPDNLINLDGPPINFSTRLVDVVSRDGAVYNQLFQEGTVSFKPTKGGRDLAVRSLDVDDTTTLLDFMNFMNEAIGIQETDPNPLNPIPGSPGGSITADSRLQFTANMGINNALDIDLSAFQLTPAGTDANESVPLQFTETQEANGEGAVADFVVYDSLGIPLSVRLTTVMESRSSTGTTYRWFADSPDNDAASGVDIAVGTGTLTFDGEGNLVSVSESTVSIERRNVASASPLEFELDFNQLSGLAEEQSTINASRQDGSAAGVLTSFIVTESGRLTGIFSNGISRDIGQLRLARFANNSGLEQVGDNLFAPGVNSGLPVEGDPGQQGIGSITAGAIELSNTDIGSNLIELILASTQYRGGTRVISSAQEMLDELLALRR